jgi:phage terminase large subunit GpA-like protein
MSFLKLPYESSQSYSLYDAIRGLSKPKPKLTGSEWADEYYHLSPESSSSPGKWTTLPYQREILDCMCDTETKQVTFKKSARVGYNKMLNACIGYFIHQDPCSILFAQPTDDEAFGISEDEIDPMIRDNDVVRELVERPRVDGRLKKAKTAKKFYPGGILEMVGAFSPKNFRRRTVRVFIADEVDGWNIGAGDEGDQLSLGKKRTNDFWNRKIIVGSTPKLKETSRVDAEFKNGDQRYYHVPCPSCNHYHPLDFENFHFDRDSDGEYVEGSACFNCPECGSIIEEKHKRPMIEKGQWVAKKPFRGHASFFIWSAYSYSANSDWGSIAKEYLETEKDKLKEQPFVNTVLGEVYEEKPVEVDTTGLMERREIYGTEVPQDVLFLTASVDTQNNRLEYDITGWGKDEENWSIDRGVIFSDPKLSSTWDTLDNILTNQTYAHPKGEMGIYATVIDYGGARSKYVAGYCKPRWKKKIFMIKGSSSHTAPIVSYRGAGKNKYNTQFFSLNVHDLKTLVYDGLENEERGAGYYHFPKNEKYDNEYFKQLLAEEKKKGKWVKKYRGIRNEALDLKVYQLGLLEILADEYKKICKRGEPELKKKPKKSGRGRVISKGIYG